MVVIGFFMYSVRLLVPLVREEFGVTMAVAVTGLIGKLAFGFATDKLNLKVGLWLAMRLVFSAFLVMATEPVYSVMLAAALLLVPLKLKDSK
jgi:uncharacterized MAPEG superfamily protein